MWCAPDARGGNSRADFPPWQTVYWYFNRWERYKVTEQILPVVREQLRIAEGRNPQPSAGLIDSQTVKVPTPSGAGPAVRMWRSG